MKYFLNLFTLWAFLINSAFGQGDPAPFVKGIGSTGLGNSASTILVPNQQSTKINAYQALIETGNKNLLVNPSFEHSTITTGWTISNATTSKVSGPDKNALRLTLTGALSVIQDSTLNAANLVGLQGVASIKIKTSTVDGLKVCSRNDGATSATLCVNVPKDGVWKEIAIPYILTGTSNGIAITSTGTTGTVDLDDSSVGTSLPIQGVSGAKLVGTLFYPMTTNCRWSLGVNASYVDFPADTDCATPTVSGSAKAPATKIPAIVLPSGSPAGTYYFSATGSFYRDTTNAYGSFRISNGSTLHTKGISNYLNGANAGSLVGSIALSTALSSDTTFKVQAKTTAANIIISNDDPGIDGLNIEVYYFPPESKIYSQASQDYDWTSYTPTFTGFGTVGGSNQCYHKRDGSDLIVRCAFVSGTPSATEARVSLPNNLVVASNVATLELGGAFGRGETTTNDHGGFILYSAGQGYVKFTGSKVFGSAAGNYFAAALGTDIANNGITLYIQETRIPIQGWQDYGVIVGSFAGIEKCANDYECTDTFSATITTTSGVVTNQNIPWVTCSAANPTVCTFNTNIKDGVNPLTQPMNCSITNAASTNVYETITASTSTAVTIRSAVVTTGAATANETFNINCQKGTNDYKPKTAKVATSTDVLFASGVGKAKVCSGVFTNNGSTVTINSQKGSCFSGASFVSTGVQTLSFNGGTWADANYVCMCLTKNNNGYCSESSGNEPTTSSIDLFTRGTANNLINDSFMVFCFGSGN